MQSPTDQQIINIILDGLPEALTVSYPELDQKDLVDVVENEICHSDLGESEMSYAMDRAADIAESLLDSKIIRRTLHRLAANMKDDFIENLEKQNKS